MKEILFAPVWILAMTCLALACLIGLLFHDEETV